MEAAVLPPREEMLVLERFRYWNDMQIIIDLYVKLLHRFVDLEAKQERALRIGESIRKLFTEARERGVRMQDILKPLIRVKSNPSYYSLFRYPGDFGTLSAYRVATDIVQYYKEGFKRYWIDSVRERITSIQRFLSSELSTIIEEIFTMLKEDSTFFEELYTIFMDDIDMQGPTEHHSVAYAVVVSAVVLLCFVFQYLIGYVDRGGSKADSSGSLEFRDTYIAIVLFLGSYIWIKSRDVAPTPIPETAIKECATHGKDGVTVKYEPRFKPRKENGVNFNRIYLGQFLTRIEAEVVFRTAASCYEYGKHYGPQVDLGDGRFFTIAPLSEEEQGLSGMEKVEMVKARAKRVHEAFVEVWNSPSTLPGAEMPQQLLLPSIQVGEGNALLQVPGNQTQDSRMMQHIRMQVFQAQHIMQTPQLPCQDISHVPQQMVEELTRQNLQLQQLFQRLEFQVQQMVQRQEQVVQRQEQVVQGQELQLQQQTRELKIYRALRKRRGSTCKKSGTQGSARKFTGLPQLLEDLVPGPSSVPNLHLQDQNPESTHLQQRNEEPMPPIFRPDGVLESTDLELPHPEEAQPCWLDQMVLDLELPRLEQDAPCVNGGDGGMCDEEPRMDGDGSDNLG